jgi:flagellar biosynthetic protein FlhB
MSSEDDAEKSFEPTQKKLDDARKKGEIARSADLQTAAAYAGFTIALYMAGPGIVSQLGSTLVRVIDQSSSLSESIFKGGAQSSIGSVASSVGLSILPLFSFPALAVIITILAQRGFVFAPTKIKPKLSKISLLSNAKNKYGRSGLFEFAKSFTKLTIYSACLFLFLQFKLPEMISAIGTSSGMVSKMLAQLCIEFLLIIVLIAGSIGSIDAFWQHSEHIRKNRMSRKEMTDEAKESEGDPHLKQERRQRAHTIAMSQMMADVPDADVILVNPTHYAVALKWSRMPGAAPICVAKGVDEVAHRIREIAIEAAVPIHSDPPTARSLYAIVKIGSEIPPDLYAAVAAAIRFSEQVKNRKKQGI